MGLEATPMGANIRALCQDGPWDGSVLLTPVPRANPLLFSAPQIWVKVDGRSAHFRSHAEAAAWIGGGYLLTRTDPMTAAACRQVRAMLGEPKDTAVMWLWYDQVPPFVDGIVLTERMARVHVLEAPVAPDPYEPTLEVRELMEEHGLNIVMHADGEISFRPDPEEHPFDFRDLDAIDRLLSDQDPD